MDDVVRYYLEDLKVGQTDSFTKTVTEADIVLFAGVSGDTNPMHLDQVYAESTMFKGRIAHGMLVVSLISCVLGTRLPGPGAIFIAQSAHYKAPVRIGDTVEARATVTEIVPERERVVLRTTCHVGDTLAVDGDATVKVPSRAGLRP